MFCEVFGKYFVWFSLGFISFEVFCPVWALYNIKRGWDTPQGPSSPGLPVDTSSVVPGARVPNGHAFAKRRQVCAAVAIALPIFLSCAAARVRHAHAILSMTVSLPIFLSRTVPFRPRRNVRASPVAVVQFSGRLPYSIPVLYVRFVVLLHMLAMRLCSRMCVRVFCAFRARKLIRECVGHAMYCLFMVSEVVLHSSGMCFLQMSNTMSDPSFCIMRCGCALGEGLR